MTEIMIWPCTLLTTVPRNWIHNTRRQTTVKMEQEVHDHKTQWPESGWSLFWTSSSETKTPDFMWKQVKVCPLQRKQVCQHYTLLIILLSVLMAGSIWDPHISNGLSCIHTRCIKNTQPHTSKKKMSLNPSHTGTQGQTQFQFQCFCLR